MKNSDMEKKREKEQRVVAKMILLYCKKNHKMQTKDSEGLCKECRDMCDYAKLRSARCPHMKEKTFCSNCKTHCYQEAYRKKIKEIMRFSGPRMLFYHPVLCIEHAILSLSLKWSKKKEKK